MTRRDSLQCIHEPFGDAFYFGPERLSARYENDEGARLASGFSTSTYKTIFDRIESEATEVCRLAFFVSHFCHSSCMSSRFDPGSHFLHFLHLLHGRIRRTLPINFRRLIDSLSYSLTLIRANVSLSKTLITISLRQIDNRPVLPNPCRPSPIAILPAKSTRNQETPL